LVNSFNASIFLQEGVTTSETSARGENLVSPWGAEQNSFRRGDSGAFPERQRRESGAQSRGKLGVPY